MSWRRLGLRALVAGLTLSRGRRGVLLRPGLMWSRPRPGQVYPERPSDWTHTLPGDACSLVPPRAGVGRDLGEFIMSARVAGLTWCLGSLGLLLRPGLQCPAEAWLRALAAGLTLSRGRRGVLLRPGLGSAETWVSLSREPDRTLCRGRRGLLPHTGLEWWAETWASLS